MSFGAGGLFTLLAVGISNFFFFFWVLILQLSVCRSEWNFRVCMQQYLPTGDHSQCLWKLPVTQIRIWIGHSKTQNYDEKIFMKSLFTTVHSSFWLKQRHWLKIKTTGCICKCNKLRLLFLFFYLKASRKHYFPLCIISYAFK